MTLNAQELELTRLEILQAFKRRFGKDEQFNRSPFEKDQVVRYQTDVRTQDVPEIHVHVRERIQAILEEVRQGRGSQIVILAGEPGMGKSHLINFFRSPERAEMGRYVLVGNSNHWKSSEFESCLLDWILDALVRPGPEQRHLLLDKVEDVAFQALTQILNTPGEIERYVAGGKVGALGRLVRRLTSDTHARFQKLVEARDVRAFRRLNFAKFAGYVCSHFLHESGHPFHRYVLHVLLRYLFPEDREKVLHWLRRRQVGDHFLRRLGAADEIDLNYKVVDAVKVLISLFTDDVAKGLSAGNPKASAPLVFFFAFDQPEGRDELFESKEDWRKFFAQLSELYNCLPNVFVLFTMTLSLSKEMHATMEGQFRDRIQRDHKFLLREIEDSEILALYEKRIDDWLGDDSTEVRPKIKALGNSFLPFDQKQVLDFGRMRTLRDMLKTFDERFRETVVEIATEAVYDYRVFQKELRREETPDDPYQYVVGHLKVVYDLMTHFGKQIASSVGLSFVKIVSDDESATPRLLEMYFADPDDSARWVRVFLGRLTVQWTNAYKAFVDKLSHRPRNKNLMFLLRCKQFDADIPDERRLQVFPCLLPVEVQTDFRATLQLIQHEVAYEPAAWKNAEDFLLKEIRATYLGQVLEEVGNAIKRQFAKDSVDEDCAPEPVDIDGETTASTLGIDLQVMEGDE